MSGNFLILKNWDNTTQLEHFFLFCNHFKHQNLRQRNIISVAESGAHNLRKQQRQDHPQKGNLYPGTTHKGPILMVGKV